MEGFLLALCVFAGCATMRETSREDQSYCLLPISDSEVVSQVSSELASIDAFKDTHSLQTVSPPLEDIPLAKNRLSHKTSRGSVLDRVLGDQSNFYSGDSMLKLGLAFGAAAVIANTQADDQLQRHFQTSVRGASSEEWFQFLHANKELGNGIYSLPVFGTVWLANEYIDGPPIFETTGLWGERSMRGFFVGAPSLILMQHITGGSRPYETIEGSEWHPFRDNNGVSGHAFMSSLPFITAAKLTDNPWQKSFWYTASTIGPLSRVNDNAHYPSQIGLGWLMAFVAASAVDQTDSGQRGWTLTPQSSLDSSGIALQYRW